MVAATKLQSVLFLLAGMMAESMQTAMCGFLSIGVRDNFGRLVRRVMRKERVTRFSVPDVVRLSGLVISSIKVAFFASVEFPFYVLV